VPLGVGDTAEVGGETGIAVALAGVVAAGDRPTVAVGAGVVVGAVGDDGATGALQAASSSADMVAARKGPILTAFEASAGS